MARETRLSMTAAEARAFLSAKRVLTLATLDEQGVPVGDVARYALDGEDLLFGIVRGGVTHRNLARDPRVACCAEQNPDYFGIAAVVVHGRATAVTDAVEETRARASLAARGAGIPTASRAGSSALGVIFRVPLGDDVMSFDFAKMRDKSHGVDR